MRLILLTFLATAGLGSAAAQSRFPVTPAHPTRFETRAVGSGVGMNAVVTETKRPELRKISYIAVSPQRAWTSREGKSVTGSLLAFEEGEVDKAPRPLTLIKDGKIRLLKRGTVKPVVFLVTLLSEEDQSYVKSLDAANREAASEAAETSDESDEKEKE